MPKTLKSGPKKVLVISPGIEDNGMRGLGAVTVSLLEGLSRAKNEVYLLTGAPIKSIGSKSPNTTQAALRRFIDHYLLDGYKSNAFVLNNKRILIYVLRDAIKLFFGKVYVTPSNHIVEMRHEPFALQRFSQVSYFINFAFIYKFSQMLNPRIRTTVIFAIARLNNIDTIITASPYALGKSLIRYKKSPRVIQYVHDVMPLNVLETPPDSIEKFAIEIEYAVKNADIVMTSSYNAKYKIEKLFPEVNCRVVYLPCEALISGHKSTFNISKNLGLKRNRYFLFMSALEARKNVARLIEAFALSASNHQQKLVIVGSKGYGWSEIESQLNALPVLIKKRIIFTGYISEKDKWQLINSCATVVHPAIDEGLGIPIIESIVASKPVIATRLNSIEEISPPNCVKYIEDPYDIYEIAQKLSEAAQNKFDIESLKMGSTIFAERFSMNKFSQRLNHIL